jgi:hypothetical protein
VSGYKALGLEVIDFLCLLNWLASHTSPKPQFVDFSALKGQGTENKHNF